MTPADPDPEIVRDRQRRRATMMALALGAFVILMFAISIAKMTVAQ